MEAAAAVVVAAEGEGVVEAVVEAVAAVVYHRLRSRSRRSRT
jgi:hypothetical protein